jgi:hypothetical protein
MVPVLNFSLIDCSDSSSNDRSVDRPVDRSVDVPLIDWCSRPFHMVSFASPKQVMSGWPMCSRRFRAFADME